MWKAGWSTMQVEKAEVLYRWMVYIAGGKAACGRLDGVQCR